jgi:hypothetical protein
MSNKKQLTVGAIIDRDEQAINSTMKLIEILKEPIERVMNEYNELGLATFDQKILEEVLKYGITKISERFKFQAANDLGPFKNNRIKQKFVDDLDSLLDPLNFAANDLKNQVRDFNRGSQYKVSAKDFIIDKNSVTVDPTSIEEFFTIAIKTEEQLEIFKKLEEAATILNEATELIEKTGSILPWPLGVFTLFKKTDNRFEVNGNTLFGFLAFTPNVIDKAFRKQINSTSEEAQSIVVVQADDEEGNKDFAGEEIINWSPGVRTKR